MLFLAGISLLLGLLNYFFFQPHIDFFQFIPLHPRKQYLIQNNGIRQFMTGYFSDFAWCSALYLVIVILSELNYLNIYCKILTLSLPFIIETAQHLGIIQGTFDWYDVLTYAITLLASIAIFPTLTLIPVKHEKQ